MLEEEERGVNASETSTDFQTGPHTKEGIASVNRVDNIDHSVLVDGRADKVYRRLP